METYTDLIVMEKAFFYFNLLQPLLKFIKSSYVRKISLAYQQISTTIK